MRRYLLPLLGGLVVTTFVVAFFALQSPASDDEQPRNDYSFVNPVTTDVAAYRNDKYGYEINYPSGWAVDDSNPRTVSFWSKENYPDYIIPNSSGLKAGIYVVAITVHSPIPAEVTLDNFVDRTMLLQDAEKHLSTKMLRINGRPAVRDHLSGSGTLGSFVTTYVRTKDAIYSVILLYDGAPDATAAIAAYDSVLATMALND